MHFLKCTVNYSDEKCLLLNRTFTETEIIGGFFGGLVTFEWAMSKGGRSIIYPNKLNKNCFAYWINTHTKKNQSFPTSRNEYTMNNCEWTIPFPVHPLSPFPFFWEEQSRNGPQPCSQDVVSLAHLSGFSSFSTCLHKSPPFCNPSICWCIFSSFTQTLIPSIFTVATALPRQLHFYCTWWAF